MFGIASFNYPQFVFKNGEKRLWNPILKKDYAIRPEEIVRLQWLDVLTNTYLWNKSRIAVEQSILTSYQTNALRADMILFDKDFKPHVLIECKAPSVPLTDNTALQAGLYNTKVDAPFIILSNGISDIILKKSDSSSTWIQSSMAEISNKKGTKDVFDVDYWIERGFLGSLIDRQKVKSLVSLLSKWFQKESEQLALYRTFNQPINDILISHFYTQFKAETCDYYMSVFASISGKTYVSVLEYHQQKITSIAQIDVDACLAETHLHALVFRKGNQNRVSIPSDLVRLFQDGVLSSPLSLALKTLFNS